MPLCRLKVMSEANASCSRTGPDAAFMALTRRIAYWPSVSGSSLGDLFFPRYRSRSA